MPSSQTPVFSTLYKAVLGLGCLSLCALSLSARADDASSTASSSNACSVTNTDPNVSQVGLNESTWEANCGTNFGTADSPIVIKNTITPNGSDGVRVGPFVSGDHTVTSENGYIDIINTAVQNWHSVLSGLSHGTFGVAGQGQYVINVINGGHMTQTDRVELEGISSTATLHTGTAIIKLLNNGAQSTSPIQMYGVNDGGTLSTTSGKTQITLINSQNTDKNVEMHGITGSANITGDVALSLQNSGDGQGGIQLYGVNFDTLKAVSGSIEIQNTANIEKLDPSSQGAIYLTGIKGDGGTFTGNVHIINQGHSDASFLGITGVDGASTLDGDLIIESKGYGIGTNIYGLKGRAKLTGSLTIHNEDASPFAITQNNYIGNTTIYGSFQSQIEVDGDITITNAGTTGGNLEIYGIGTDGIAKGSIKIVNTGTVHSGIKLVGTRGGWTGHGDLYIENEAQAGAKATESWDKSEITITGVKHDSSSDPAEVNSTGTITLINHGNSPNWGITLTGVGYYLKGFTSGKISLINTGDSIHNGSNTDDTKTGITMTGLNSSTTEDVVDIDLQNTGTAQEVNMYGIGDGTATGHQEVRVSIMNNPHNPDQKPYEVILKGTDSDTNIVSPKLTLHVINKQTQKADGYVKIFGVDGDLTQTGTAADDLLVDLQSHESAVWGLIETWVSGHASVAAQNYIVKMRNADNADHTITVQAVGSGDFNNPESTVGGIDIENTGLAGEALYLTGSKKDFSIGAPNLPASKAQYSISVVNAVPADSAVLPQLNIAAVKGSLNVRSGAQFSLVEKNTQTIKNTLQMVGLGPAADQSVSGIAHVINTSGTSTLTVSNVGNSQSLIKEMAVHGDLHSTHQAQILVENSGAAREAILLRGIMGTLTQDNDAIDVHIRNSGNSDTVMAMGVGGLDTAHGANVQVSNSGTAATLRLIGVQGDSTLGGDSVQVMVRNTGATKDSSGSSTSAQLIGLGPASSLPIQYYLPPAPDMSKANFTVTAKQLDVEVIDTASTQLEPDSAVVHGLLKTSEQTQAVLRSNMAKSNLFALMANAGTQMLGNNVITAQGTAQDDTTQPDPPAIPFSALFSFDGQSIGPDDQPSAKPGVAPVVIGSAQSINYIGRQLSTLDSKGELTPYVDGMGADAQAKSNGYAIFMLATPLKTAGQRTDILGSVGIQQNVWTDQSQLLRIYAGNIVDETGIVDLSGTKAVDIISRMPYRYIPASEAQNTQDYRQAAVLSMDGSQVRFNPEVANHVRGGLQAKFQSQLTFGSKGMMPGKHWVQDGYVISVAGSTVQFSVEGEGPQKPAFVRDVMFDQKWKGTEPQFPSGVLNVSLKDSNWVITGPSHITSLNAQGKVMLDLVGVLNDQVPVGKVPQLAALPDAASRGHALLIDQMQGDALFLMGMTAAQRTVSDMVYVNSSTPVNMTVDVVNWKSFLKQVPLLDNNSLRFATTGDQARVLVDNLPLAQKGQEQTLRVGHFILKVIRLPYSPVNHFAANPPAGGDAGHKPGDNPGTGNTDHGGGSGDHAGSNPIHGGVTVDDPVDETIETDLELKDDGGHGAKPAQKAPHILVTEAGTKVNADTDKGLDNAVYNSGYNNGKPEQAEVDYMFRNSPKVWNWYFYVLRLKHVDEQLGVNTLPYWSWLTPDSHDQREASTTYASGARNLWVRVQGRWARDFSGHRLQGRNTLVQLGVDYELPNPQWRLSGYVEAQHLRMHEDHTANSTHAALGGVGLDLSYRHQDLYGDVVLGYRGGDLFVEGGAVEGTAHTSAALLHASLEVGKAWHLGQRLALTPEAQLDTAFFIPSNYALTTRLVKPETVKSLTTRLGLKAGVHTAHWGLWARADWHHEFLGQERVRIEPFNDSDYTLSRQNKGNWFSAGLGTQWIDFGHWSVHGDAFYEWGKTQDAQKRHALTLDVGVAAHF